MHDEEVLHYRHHEHGCRLVDRSAIGSRTQLRRDMHRAETSSCCCRCCWDCDAIRESTASEHNKQGLQQTQEQDASECEALGGRQQTTKQPSSSPNKAPPTIGTFVRLSLSLDVWVRVCVFVILSRRSLAVVGRSRAGELDRALGHSLSRGLASLAARSPANPTSPIQPNQPSQPSLALHLVLAHPSIHPFNNVSTS